MMKSYITDEEIDAITNAIYNDDNTSLFKNLPKGNEVDYKRQVIADLAQGQEYYIIPDSFFMVRQDGRMFNIKHIRPLKPLWIKTDFLLNYNGMTARFSQIYDKMGWDYDHEELTKTYARNGWSFTASKLYRQWLIDTYGAKV